MRFVFPIAIVSVTAHVPWRTVIDEALHHPTVYAHQLDHAHTAIAAFGGSFLLVLALYFLFDDERDILWLKRLERRLQSFGGGVWLPPVPVALIIIIMSLFAGDRS